MCILKIFRKFKTSSSANNNLRDEKLYGLFLNKRIFETILTVISVAIFFKIAMNGYCLII